MSFNLHMENDIFDNPYHIFCATAIMLEQILILQFESLM